MGDGNTIAHTYVVSSASAPQPCRVCVQTHSVLITLGCLAATLGQGCCKALYVWEERGRMETKTELLCLLPRLYL